MQLYSNFNNYLPLTGGTLSGHSVGLCNGNGYLYADVNSLGMYARKTINDDNNRRELIILNQSYTSNLSSALRFTDKVNGVENMYTIYGTHNKPTPADIGAAAASHTHSYAASSHSHAAGTITAGTLVAGVIATNSTDYTTYRLRNIAASTGAVTAGSTALTNGTIYLQYE